MKFTITTVLGTALLSTAPAFAQPTPSAPITTTLAVPFVQIPYPAPVAPTRQPSGLADIIRAKFPLSVGFDELGNGWRVLNWMGTNYFTKGEATFVRDDEFLVAYRQSDASVRALNPRDYAYYVTRGSISTRGTVRFSITLLPMSDVQGSITRGQVGLKSFDLNDYKIDAPPADSSAFQQNLGLVYLRKLNDALSTYSSVNLQVLPPLDTAFAARQALEPFAENAAIFTQPGQTTPFRFNPILSGRKKAHLKGKGSFVLAYEAVAAPDGSRGVLRLNGSVLRVGDKTWLLMKEASKIEG